MHGVLTSMSWFVFFDVLMFQVFQVTAHVVRGPASRGEKFIISVDRGYGVLLCVQDIVRSPHFKQGSFFSDFGLTMLSESVAIAYSNTSNPVYAPWSIVESASASQVITDWRACWDRVVLCRRNAKDSSERWYHGGARQHQDLECGAQMS